MSLVLFLALQQDIQELIQQLQDDSIEVRDEAARKLMDVGPKALPYLEEAAKTGDDELRSRVAQITAEIKKRGKLREVMRTPSRVTLDLKDASLRAALEDLAKKTGNEIDATKVPADAKVTFSCQDALFWDALNGLCRAHGNVNWAADRKIVVTSGKWSECPGRVHGPMVVRLRRLEWRDVKSFGQNNYTYLTVQFDVAWEKGTQPGSIRFVPAAFKDDKGTDLLDPERDSWAMAEAREGQVGAMMMMYQYKPPHEEATAIDDLRGELHIDFPLSYVTLSFPDPASKVNTVQTVDNLSLTLRRFDHRGGMVYCEVSTGRQGNLYVNSLEVVDAGGKVYPLDQRGSYSDGRQSTFQLGGMVPPKAEIKELRYRAAKEVHTETVPLEFRKIPIR